MGEEGGQGVFSPQLMREAWKSVTPLVPSPTASTLSHKESPLADEGLRTSTSRRAKPLYIPQMYVCNSSQKATWWCMKERGTFNCHSQCRGAGTKPLCS